MLLVQELLGNSFKRELWKQNIVHVLDMYGSDICLPLLELREISITNSS